MRCAVYGCNIDDQAKHFKKGAVMFFRFPNETTLRKTWQNACCRCLNIGVPEADSRKRKKAYGLSLDLQKNINKMTDGMKNLRVKGKSSLLPLQTGKFLISI